MPRVSKQTTKLVSRKRGSSVIDRIAPVSLAPGGIKLNVYGRSGTGKTTFACTFPKPLLLIGAEDGTRSVYDVEGVEFVKLDESGELTDLVEYIASSGKYKSIVLDAASSLQDMILKEILGVDELPAQRSWGMASRDTWGQCAMQTKERLRSILGLAELLKIDVVIIAQERAFNDDGESEILAPSVASALTPGVTGWLNPVCDYLVQTFIRQKVVTKTTKVAGKEVQTKSKSAEIEYCLRTAPDPVYTIKFRLPKGSPLPPAIVDPSYDKIINLIQGG